MANKGYVRGRSLKQRVLEYFDKNMAGSVTSFRLANRRLRYRFGISNSYLSKLKPLLVDLQEKAFNEEAPPPPPKSGPEIMVLPRVGSYHRKPTDMFTRAVKPLKDHLDSLEARNRDLEARLAQKSAEVENFKKVFVAALEAAK